MRLIALFIVICTIVVGVFYYQHMEKSINTDNNQASALEHIKKVTGGEIPDSFIEKGTIYSYDNAGQLKQKLHSHWIQMFDQEQVILLSEPKFQIHNDQGTVWNGQSKKGALHNKTGLLDMVGDVVLWQSLLEGRRQFKTEILHYNTRTQMAETTAPVLFQQPKHNIKGVGMLADVNKGVYSILSSVKGSHYDN